MNSPTTSGPASSGSAAMSLSHGPQAAIASRAELERLLADDVPYGDLTTEALGIGAVRGTMHFTARDAMVLALAEDAAAIIAMAGGEVELMASSGTALAPGALILTARGPASALLRSWKVAQTLIEIWSGVASDARAIVAAATAVAPHISVACTRKNVPGAKRYAVAAVKAGGAVMHRLGLSETILVFPEHQAFLRESLAETVQRLHRTAPEKKLVVEINGIEAGVAAASAGFDVIQAEKLSPAEFVVLAAKIASATTLRPVLAAAGGIGIANAAAYAQAGADVLVTSAPYLARPRDVQVRIVPSSVACADGRPV